MSSYHTFSSVDESKDDHLHHIRASEKRNVFVLAVHYVLLRLGWIFKTETVIMPSFMDAVSGAGWLRGCLPVVNRSCSSLPPVFVAERVRNTREKKWALVISTCLMACPFIALSALWYYVHEHPPAWMAGLFLGCYALFFVVTGVNRLCYNTTQGKLIRANRRGRLLAIAGVLGSALSIMAVWLLLPRWLEIPDHYGYVFIFGMTGLGFILAGTVCMFIDEPADKPAKVNVGWRHHIQEAWRIWSTDQDFRILAVAAMLFVMIQLAFPHFQLLGKQALAREGVDVQSHGFHLMIWVVSQNAAVGIFSLISGLIADRWGNRLAIRIQVFAVSLAPVGALLLGSGLIDDGVRWYGIVFFLLGLAPVTFSTLNNYVLELAVTSDHPRYVSTLSVCMAVPFCFSPLVGALLDHFGFPVVFTCITALIALGGAMTFWMSEPRHNESGPSRV